VRSDCLEPNAENATEAELLVAMEAAPNKRSYRRLAAAGGGASVVQGLHAGARQRAFWAQ